MEQIRKAVELAREAGPRVDDGAARNWRRQRIDPSDSRADARSSLRIQSRPDLREVLDDDQRADNSYLRLKEVTLNAAHLEAHRIVSHDIADSRSKSFDMLRTQVLQTMDRQNWRFLAVTSPTAGCGKTVTAINLALSIARQRERSVLLVDMDLQKPQVGRCLGIKCGPGLLAAIDGSATLAGAVVEARIRSAQLAVLPIEKPVSNSSEWMASRAMSAVLEDIRKDFSSRVVIFDMPPMLYSDEVITILPQIDCVLLVAAVGTTTTSEIAQCNRHLESADVVRLVLNKVPGASNKYYY